MINITSNNDIIKMFRRSHRREYFLLRRKREMRNITQAVRKILVPKKRPSNLPDHILSYKNGEFTRMEVN